MQLKSITKLVEQSPPYGAVGPPRKSTPDESPRLRRGFGRAYCVSHPHENDL